MKKDLKTSEEKLMHAALAEDARLSENAHDQELLKAINQEISSAPHSIVTKKRNWQLPVIGTAVAACLVVSTAVIINKKESKNLVTANEAVLDKQPASKGSIRARDLLNGINKELILSEEYADLGKNSTPETILNQASSKDNHLKAKSFEGISSSSGYYKAEDILLGQVDSSWDKEGSLNEVDDASPSPDFKPRPPQRSASLSEVEKLDTEAVVLSGKASKKNYSPAPKKSQLRFEASNGRESKETKKGHSITEAHFGSRLSKNKAVYGDTPLHRDRKAITQYAPLVDQPFRSPFTPETQLSTFSIDTDRASYTNVRNNIRNDVAINKDSVRVEEFLNAFDYDYEQPTDKHPFAVHVESTSAPWSENTRLVKIGIKGQELDREARPATNLVLLCDVSGSMNNPNKLGYLKSSLMELIENLDERDSVSIVTYAGYESVLLEPTKITNENQQEVFAAIENLGAGGSTNGGAGIRKAYQLANQNFVKDGVNRVILATDGDFNVGVTGNDELLEVVKSGGRKGTYLTVLGFGNNLNDNMLEKITNDGNGQYFFVDSQQEGHRIFSKELTGTLVTIAKDVKIQVEFNPAKVEQYRLIGYANRQLKNEDFNDDRVDAGEIGAGHTVTAIYEIVPGKAKPPVDNLKYGKKVSPAEEYLDNNELLTVKLRYKQPDSSKSTLIEKPFIDPGKNFESASKDLQFASSVAMFGMILRESEGLNGADLNDVLRIAEKSEEVNAQRKEFNKLVQTLKEKQ